MVNRKDQLKGDTDVPYRRRGRPAGKNRVPLSLEERRARNAHYERERRNETAEVMTQLAEAANCDPNISNADLLATVISKLERASRKKSENLEDLERINANLESQIASLQSRLGLDDASFELLDEGHNDLGSISHHSDATSYCDYEDRSQPKQTKKRKRQEQDDCEYIKQEKRTKIQRRKQSETWSDQDSGVELRSHTISPPQMCVQDNLQYLMKSEPQQFPVDVTEEQDCVSQSQIDVQTELYNQLYNSENQSQESKFEPDWDVNTLSIQPVPCIDSLTRSLIVVPPIRSPREEPPDLRIEHQIRTEPIVSKKEEPPCDLNTPNDCDIFEQDLTTLDFLTDTEKGLLTDLIGADFLETYGNDNGIQEQSMTYPFEDLPAGY